MCGIAGYLTSAPRFSAAQMQASVAAMAGTLDHRGPDDAGCWFDASQGVALGHTRLSILDLSPLGHQPMESACRRFCLVYNGEIYNFADLRAELETAGHAFRGHSDTEVLLAAIVQWGVPAALQRLIGMFALAVWDRQARKLLLARDRLGIKPLYYGVHRGVFLFGSELKALRVHPSFRHEVNREALCLFLQHSYIPAPYSIYQGIFKLPAGYWLEVTADQLESCPPQPYWTLADAAARGAAQPFAGSVSEAAEEFDRRLGDAVRLRMVADVPVGAFLSGGIDSSAVVAAMQARSTAPVRTFCIGFQEPAYNEAPYAEAVARHLQTEHTTLYATPEQARDVIPRLPALFDEPFGDSSQIPTFLVSQLARRDVTVSLSGDGGDELFGGYQRYADLERRWAAVGWLPAACRQWSAAMLGTMTGGRLRSLRGLLESSDSASLYLHSHAHWRAPEQLVIGGRVPESLFSRREDWCRSPRFRERMMFLDTLTYLPDDILVKVDRASMGVGLEARVPLLDHRLVEFVWSLPWKYRVHRGRSKWLLRRVLGRYVPPKLFQRPKVGFGVPIDQWLRGELRPWAEALLDERRLTREGFLQPRPIREKWQQHLSGRANWQYLLWDVLMFQTWLESQSGATAGLEVAHSDRK